MTSEQLPFRDPHRGDEERTADLLGRLTPDERMAMLHQFAPAVERLGVPAFRTGQEALHGVAWMGPATVFPQAVGLGATWDEELLREIGEAVGREVLAMRSRDPRVGLNVWSPTVNLLRHPLWGRNEEGYAEDPRLTAALATGYTRGLRGDHPDRWRTAPILKHWLAHNHETDRDTASTSVPPRVLHEYELPAFRGPVRAGAVAGVMPAYNLVNGRPNHLSPLLESRLRAWTELPLVVCSDAGAPTNIAGSEAYYPDHASGLAAALRAGVDSFTDHGEDGGPTLERLREALERGLISQEHIDAAVLRLLGMRLRLGEFDPDGGPFADPGERAFDTPEHRALALRAAEAAIVLLRNAPPVGGERPAGEDAGDAPLLPLPAGSRVAVVGLLADECKLDWYSGALLHRSTPLDGLREHPGIASVTYAEGTDRVRLRCADGWIGVPGMPDAEGTGGAEGVGETDAADAGALDPALLRGRTDLPPLTVGPEWDAADLHLVDWGGGALTLRAGSGTAGRYLSVAEDGLVRASARQPGGWVVQEVFTAEPVPDTTPTGAERATPTDAAGIGDIGPVLLRHRGTGRPLVAAPGGLRVVGDGEEPTAFTAEVVSRGTEEVAAAAAGADVVVVVAGNDPHINGRETEDRVTLALPDQQDRLWRTARDANPRTVLVLSSSYPYAVTEAAAELPALLWTAHGGQAAGTALARVLCGDLSPAGRLPQTWYASDADLPDLLDYDVIGSRLTYLYHPGEPLFPFGHGLSYTSFGYRDPSVPPVTDGTLRVEVTVVNTGDRAGEEVVQLYTRALPATDDGGAPGPVRPLRALAAHRRLRLEAGESRRIALEAPAEEVLGLWDPAAGRWRVPGGRYAVEIGASSRDIRATVEVEVAGEPARPRPVATVGLAAADADVLEGVELVDRDRESGDAATPRDPASPARLLYRGCDLGAAGAPAVTVTVTAAADGESGRVELRVPGAEPVGITVPAGADRYDHRRFTVELPLPDGVGDGPVDLGITLRGPVRFAELGCGDRPGDGLPVV
ncbi:glycoside hydrolase family 3 C-terminal domain-containing protein [Streptomyces sp. ST2-7A]|uniref:glycoside hydrolase family 3 C-terminal domain-containing protein n=1 Tax=Streptomyces sp. ST2-7A TaxID=2907214 RepID=UPI001F29066F|nr:glycoside hydrolase family 3 C-terminal domain-containing protein [Streptomyces sp. ST2-7A]MCE7080001.1 glycoside hydrolase family 3 C-terminal domain-containing protein [Streptomyces sp. ST2-7A]